MSTAGSPQNTGMPAAPRWDRSKPIRKKPTITTEVLRTLSGDELATAAGGNLRGVLDKVKGVLHMGSGVNMVDFGATVVCGRKLRK